MNQVYDIDENTLQVVKQVLREHLPGAKVSLFGSRATGQAKPYSDVDLVIDAGVKLSLEQSAILAEAFQESALPYKVDFVDWYGISEEFRQNIQSEMKPIEY